MRKNPARTLKRPFHLQDLAALKRPTAANAACLSKQTLTDKRSSLQEYPHKKNRSPSSWQVSDLRQLQDQEKRSLRPPPRLRSAVDQLVAVFANPKTLNPKPLNPKTLKP